MAAVETGRHHTSYRSELRLWHTRPQIVRMAVLAVIVIILPFILDDYWLALANTALIAAIGAIGLNILVGYTGQISLGQGGFLAVGAFTSAILTDRLGMPAPVSIIGAVMLTAAIGVIVGLPALRLKGLYLAIATLASQMVILFIVRRWEFLTEGQGFLDVARLEVFGFRLDRANFEQQWYMILLVLAILAALTATNLFRTGVGRSFMAVRDQDIAASAMGVNLTRAKLTAFAVSNGYVGLAGALMAHYTEILSWEKFTLDVSILYLAMIIVGGMGSVAGAVYGAVFITLLPVLVREAADVVGGAVPIIRDQLPAVEHGVFGLTIIVFLIFEPCGLNRIWERIKDWFGYWPFRY
ncbi:amino acid/amide ABC transporter membrane protein 2, HAAT family [Brevibacterium sp. Mu109]|uniref:branched-chain amino acid ABC transporter permease n=1 Tax=Brevibacterium sp. Mu109 TaxID=1255669 RepID=UPI000C46FD1F|nr:branched-chain amino acid ABC transporter permease [Brevibacterium sp. Mu109]SMX76458.1 amino acid/amide ABC transporter membrane protein 2, HAAT family [Brevibacterium sp. Mu109]